MQYHFVMVIRFGSQIIWLILHILLSWLFRYFVMFVENIQTWIHIFWLNHFKLRLNAMHILILQNKLRFPLSFSLKDSTFLCWILLSNVFDQTRSRLDAFDANMSINMTVSHKHRNSKSHWLRQRYLAQRGLQDPIVF